MLGYLLTVEQRMFEGTLNCKLSHFRQGIIDTAMDQWRKHLQACVRANGGPFVNKLLQTVSIFHVFLVQVASAAHGVSFLLC